MDRSESGSREVVGAAFRGGPKGQDRKFEFARRIVYN
jgi:hypothetical protein